MDEARDEEDNGVMDDDEGRIDEIANDKVITFGGSTRDSTLDSTMKEDAMGKEDTGVLIAVGKKFGSFADLERTITLFEEKIFVKIWKREDRTIEAAKKRIDRHINPKLKYYELKYACIHGAQKFRPKGKRNRDTL